MSGTAVAVVVVVAPVITVLFLDFDLTKPNSTSTRRQNVHVHKIFGGKMLLLRNFLLGIMTPTDTAAAVSTNKKYVGNAVIAELLVGDDDPPWWTLMCRGKTVN